MATANDSNASETKSEWTSLEKAKLIASCATPLLIFIFGLIVAAYVRSEETQRRKDEIEAAQLREDRLAAAAQRREDRAAQSAADRLAADRRATLLRNAAQREEARKDARELSLIAFQREQILIDRSAAREEAQRVRQRREAQTEKVLDKRREIWASAVPFVVNARWRLYDVIGELDKWSSETIKELNDEAQLDVAKARDIIIPYQSYFTSDFIDAFLVFGYAASGVNFEVRSFPSKTRGRDSHAASVERSFKTLILMANDELARVEGGDITKARAEASIVDLD